MVHSQIDVPKQWKVLFGGISGMIATSVAHPFDLLKVRMQLAKTTSSVDMIKNILNKEGIRGLYSGLSAGLLRQATYTTTRLGVYNWMYDSYLGEHKQYPPLRWKILIGVYAGIVGAFVGTPSEVVLVRMMANGVNPQGNRRKYKGLLHAIYRIVNDEGFLTLWRGGLPTITRSILVSTAQLGTYTQARELLLQRGLKDDLPLHFITSVIASFATAVASLPADNIKTRAQFVGEKLGQFGILFDIIKNDGFFTLWRGFVPYYTRLAIHTILTFVVLEELNGLYLRKNKKE